GIVGVGYASVTPPALGNGIDNDGVVRSMTARVHEHCPLEAQDRLQLLEPGERRVGWRVSPVRCVRISVTGAEYVAVRIAAAGRRPELRTARVGVRRLTGRDIG